MTSYCAVSRIIAPCCIPLYCALTSAARMGRCRIGLHCAAFGVLRVWCCAALYCTELHSIALRRAVLHCAALHCTISHCMALGCTPFHCVALNCIVLRAALWCGTPSQFVTSYCVVSRVITPCCTPLYCAARHCTVVHTLHNCAARHATVLHPVTARHVLLRRVALYRARRHSSLMRCTILHPVYVGTHLLPIVSYRLSFTPS